jgi:chromatin remodeling complex protein RSC6
MERFKMATAKKATPATKTAPAKTAAPAAKKAAPAKRTPNAAFMKALTPSPQLAAVIGAQPLPRTEVTKKIWEYIKAHKLQDEANKRNINADAKLKEIFKKPQVSMFEMTKLVNSHLSYLVVALPKTGATAPVFFRPVQRPAPCRRKKRLIPKAIKP